MDNTKVVGNVTQIQGGDPKGGNSNLVFGKPGGSSGPATPGPKGSSAPAGGSVSQTPVKNMDYKMAIDGATGGNPVVSKDIPKGYEAPKVPTVDMTWKMGVSQSSAGSSNKKLTPQGSSAPTKNV